MEVILYLAGCKYIIDLYPGASADDLRVLTPCSCALTVAQVQAIQQKFVRGLSAQDREIVHHNLQALENKRVRPISELNLEIEQVDAEKDEYRLHSSAIEPAVLVVQPTRLFLDVAASFRPTYDFGWLASFSSDIEPRQLYKRVDQLYVQHSAALRVQVRRLFIRAMRAPDPDRLQVVEQALQKVEQELQARGMQDVADQLLQAVRQLDLTGLMLGEGEND